MKKFKGHFSGPSNPSTRPTHPTCPTRTIQFKMEILIKMNRQRTCLIYKLRTKIRNSEFAFDYRKEISLYESDQKNVHHKIEIYFHFIEEIPLKFTRNKKKYL